MQWVKSDATPQRFSQDSIECQQEAWREARLRAWHYSALGPYPSRDRFGRPAFAWPYSPWGDPCGDTFLEEGRLASFCMRSKGYELVPVEKPAAPQKEAPAEPKK
jgi:hypothetical protein